MKFNNLIPVILSRAVEQELSDSNEQLSEAVVTNQSITAAKRKMEQEMSTLQVSLVKTITLVFTEFYSRVSWTRWRMRRPCPRRAP